MASGYFIDWNGKIRSTDDPGGGYVCDVDLVARYVGIKTNRGTLVHEATYYPDLATIERKGIRGELVPGSHPWGPQE